MQPIASAESSEWINGNTARQLLDCTITALQRAALVGLIRVRLIPGMPPRYNRADVERYAQEMAPKAKRQHYARKKPRSGTQLAS